jgi:hypothetical protein
MGKKIFNLFTDYVDSIRALEGLVDEFSQKLKELYYVKQSIEGNRMKVEKFDETSIQIQIANEKFLVHFKVITPKIRKPEIWNIRQLAEITFLEFNLNKLDDNTKFRQLGESVFLGNDLMLRDKEGIYIDQYSNTYESQIFSQLVSEIVKDRGLLEEEL